VTGLDLAGAKVLVQGFGNVGSVAARLIAEAGATVVGIADEHGGVYNPNGLDIDALIAQRDRTGTVLGAKETETVSNSEFLELPCDILIPAAVEGQITAENAPRIKATMIAEGANGPTTPEADAILRDRGIFVIPDVLANAGGVTVSYFEWVQALQFFPWTEAMVNERLKTIMSEAFQAVYAASEKYNVHMRTAALVRAIERVAEFTRLRGIYP
jgi:glutamate dehydrogenase (NAD(P)+)